jgi:hypothetical protein
MKKRIKKEDFNIILDVKLNVAEIKSLINLLSEQPSDMIGYHKIRKTLENLKEK